MHFMKRLLVALLCATTVAAQARGVPVVLISIDGLKPDYVLDADRHGLRVSHLRRMLAEGSYAKAVTGVLPTVTYPSHTTMVTGVSPKRHGILYNSPFDPFGRNQGGWMWYAEDVTAPTLWQVVNRAGFTTSSVDWPVTVGASITYNIAQYWRATTDDDHKLLRALSTPGLLDEGEKAVGRYPAGYVYTVEADRRRADFAAWIIASKRPRFHMSYFGVLDEIEHAEGPYTANVFTTIEALDGMIGRVAQAATAVDPKTVVCVVSDHGFARYDKNVSINVALKDAGFIDVDPQGTLKDWRAITYGPAVVVKDRNDTSTIRAVGTVLTKLAADPATGVFRVLDNAALQTDGGFPDAAFVVGVRPGYSISGRLTGALVQSQKPGGTHGLLRELPEMDSAFFIVGSGVPKGRVFERIDMRDIAPTLAGLAGVSMPNVEGHDLFAQR